MSNSTNELLETTIERVQWIAVPDNLVGKHIKSHQALKTILLDLALFYNAEVFNKTIHSSLCNDYTIHCLRVIDKKSEDGVNIFQQGILKIAYECNGCHKILIGPPKITTQYDFKSTDPRVSGVYNLNCTSCGYLLDSVIITHS